MRKWDTALAAGITVLLTGYAAAVVVAEKGVPEVHASGEGITIDTENEVPRRSVCDVSCRLLRRVRERYNASGVGKEVLQSLESTDDPLKQRAKAGEMRLLDPTVSSGAKAIWIYLEAQEAFLTEYGIVVKTYQISSGAPATPTPRGEFKIYKKEDLRVSGQAVPYRMPKYMSFTKNSAFGLHSLPYLGISAESSGYWSEALSHIGIPVSHGCVRFLPEEATEIYEWADIGIPVFIQS
ncbi:hypothetical protein AUJ46_05240 [Candidatus Peregrinibacteria bacterium CG1_02_54_53]|nr:MAG: hypothetical protein AUJ46_05240 [Candidatus Peregrinibacteria bacterium CG1_02_54_53]